MHVHIENFRNIDSLDYEIEDGKVNYLFGICGSGKTSIMTAVSRDARVKDASVGKDLSEVVVSIDGENGPAKDVRVYNAEEQEVIFRKESSTGSYEVFVGREDALRLLESQFNDAVADLTSFREQFYTYQGKRTVLHVSRENRRA